MTLVAAGGVCALLWLLGWLARPDLETVEGLYEEQQLEAVQEERSWALDPDAANRPRIQKEVDYAEYASAHWRPRGESPILAELVAEGKLPPVAERVGPEPVVVEGRERGLAPDDEARKAYDNRPKYGGSWVYISSNPGDISTVINSRLSYVALLRWSPQGEPLVPHVARSWTVSPDNREFTFELRRGIKWSDGTPFTADDVMYWWEAEAKCEELTQIPPALMTVQGELGTVEMLGPHTVKFSFPKPYGMFLENLATWQGRVVADCPRHYLEQYHPQRGDKKLIEKAMAARKLPTAVALYREIKRPVNPEHPRLWPWVYRTHKARPPQVFVRNPYYFMVDRAGNQLPYIDRLVFDTKSSDMIGLAASNGELTLQGRHISNSDYTMLMSQREQGNYRVLHWKAGVSEMTVWPNINRRQDDVKSRWKHKLLNDKRFRQALSLAIDRKSIIESEYNNMVEASQVAPLPGSPFHVPEASGAFTEYDPKRANALLDAIDLPWDGPYRTFPDGTEMSFFLDVASSYGGERTGPTHVMINNWRDIGVRVILRLRSRNQFGQERINLLHDLDVWSGHGFLRPLAGPEPFAGGPFAMAYSDWYKRGGLYLPDDHPRVNVPRAKRPPEGHPLLKNMRIFESALAEQDVRKQAAIFREAMKAGAEQCWSINISTPPPQLVVAKKDLHNVPPRAVYIWEYLSPANTGIETFFFDNPAAPEGVAEQTKQEIAKVTPPSYSVSGQAKAEETGGVGLIVKTVLAILAAGGILAAAVLHPYIGRRLVIMVPTLVVISVVVFSIIQLPPGDYLENRILMLQMSGDEAEIAEAEGLRKVFHLDKPMVERYARWMGLYWFGTFDQGDEGLLQGNLGRRMEDGKSVNDIIGDRILLTFLMSLGTILFTWAVAIPIGIYSAVKQYSAGDYVLTFIGFIGMCIPPFLLALLVMYAGRAWFGLAFSGLFSPRYAAQEAWTWGKFTNLLSHLWVPVVVLGVGGTAGMIRVMRGNLLDELKKPYVTTARAKGVRPMKLLFKYPVRLALNPFISGIGALFPMLVSGGAIVAMVLSLPTVGPLMLQALQLEDMYLAGSMLMVLSLLGVIGTLVSDLLLLWLDPRIRFQGGGR